VTAKLESEVRKELGLITNVPAAPAQPAAQGASASARVTTMPTGTESKSAPARR